MKRFAAVLSFVCLASTADAGSIVLTGHDPDFHAVSGSAAAVQGAIDINNALIDYILDPLFNPIVAGGTSKFLFVEAYMAPPSGHRIGEIGIQNSGYTAGIDYEKHGAATLAAELDQLGTKYAGIVVASDFGGLLTQAELDILNSYSANIVDFLNTDGGGLYAMAESGNGNGLTTGGWYGYLPFVVSSVPANQREEGTTVTAFGASLGLDDADVSVNFSHNIFADDFGLNVVDRDSEGRILTLAGRGTIDPETGVVPLPAGAVLLFSGLVLLGAGTRRRG